MIDMQCIDGDNGYDIIDRLGVMWPCMAAGLKQKAI